MMNENMRDMLETSLQELYQGGEMRFILARYPKFAAELRPLLKASLRVKPAEIPAPSPSAMIRGRARLMQRTAELREQKNAPRKRAFLFFRKLAYSFALVFLLIISGSGLLRASASTLPGQKLYPVKRGWENMRLLLTFNEEAREYLEHEIEDERLHEVNELLEEDEHRRVDFSGVFTMRNDAAYVSEVRVLFPAGAQIPPEGATIHIIGWTTEKGYVEIERFEILQANSVNSTIDTTPSLNQGSQTPPIGFADENQEDPTQPVSEDDAPEVEDAYAPDLFESEKGNEADEKDNEKKYDDETENKEDEEDAEE